MDNTKLQASKILDLIIMRVFLAVRRSNKMVRQDLILVTFAIIAKFPG